MRTVVVGVAVASVGMVIPIATRVTVLDASVERPRLMCQGDVANVIGVPVVADAGWPNVVEVRHHTCAVSERLVRDALHELVETQVLASGVNASIAAPVLVSDSVS